MCLERCDAVCVLPHANPNPNPSPNPNPNPNPNPKPNSNPNPNPNPNQVSDRRLPPLQPADLELDPEMRGSFEELLRTRSMGDEIQSHQGIDARSRGEGGEMEELMRPPLVDANGRPVSSAGGG